MSNKILTISIAAYNVEKYIRQGLDSIVNAGCLDDLEVFVIDDGGKDATLAIAQEYEAKYPQTFHAIHKENGGYGSTVNWSVRHATGKYFKLLDGDDWLHSENLNQLVQRMKVSDADAFVNNCVRAVEGGAQKIIYQMLRAYDGKSLSVNEMAQLPPLAMWALSIKTTIVKNNHCDLPERLLYTDRIYLINSMKELRSFDVLGGPIYYWRIGRDGQSNDINSIKKHYQELIIVDRMVFEIYNQFTESERNAFISKRFAAFHALSLAMISMLPHCKKYYDVIVEEDRYLRKVCPYIYNANESKRLRIMRKTGYLAYWVNYPKSL